jgi:hypothetical protein
MKGHSMKYASPWELNKEVLVNSALAKFKETNGLECGYDILRYAAKGVLKTSAEVSTDEFVNWYPLNMGYVILRLAKAGNLEYKAA